MKALTCILSFAVILTHMPFADADSSPAPTQLEELKAQFPNARFVEVTQAEFDHIMAANEQAAVMLTEPPDEPADGHPDSSPAPREAVEHRPPPPDGAVVPARARIRTRSRAVPHVDVAVYGHGTGSIATDDLAVILYVLAGVVVIAAAFIYGGVIIYELITGRHEYRYWRDLTVSGWYFGGAGRKGGMVGGRAGLGLIGEFNRVGLILEAGYLDGRFRFRDDVGSLSVSGLYGLLGPSVQWPLTDGPNPVSLDFELLTGYSTANQVGLMSRAMAGFSRGWGPTWRTGLMAGSTYAKIRETEGPLTTKSDFNLTIGGWLGARF